MRPHFILTIVGLITAAGVYTLSLIDQSHDSRVRVETGGASRFFSNAEGAVRDINRLLYAENWQVLAAYYDLAGSGLSPDDLTSGAYFQNGRTMPVSADGAQPAALPFPKGASFRRIEPTAEPDVFTITVSLPARQTVAGGGSPPMLFSFPVRRLPEGYRLLPPNPAE